MFCHVHTEREIMNIESAITTCKDCEQHEGDDKCTACAVDDLMFMLAVAPSDLKNYMPRIDEAA